MIKEKLTTGCFSLLHCTLIAPKCVLIDWTAMSEYLLCSYPLHGKNITIDAWSDNTNFYQNLLLPRYYLWFDSLYLWLYSLFKDLFSIFKVDVWFLIFMPIISGGGFFFNLNPEQDILRGRPPLHRRVQSRVEETIQPLGEPKHGRRPGRGASRNRCFNAHGFFDPWAMSDIYFC